MQTTNNYAKRDNNNRNLKKIKLMNSLKIGEKKMPSEFGWRR